MFSKPVFQTKIDAMKYFDNVLNQPQFWSKLEIFYYLNAYCLYLKTWDEGFMWGHNPKIGIQSAHKHITMSNIE